MEIREEHQLSPVADPVSALVAVTRPIIASVMQSISGEVISEFGHSRADLPLHLLGRLRKEGDGDCGIAFEYAIHEGIATGDPVLTERVVDALKMCKITGGDPASILFAIEKSGSQQLLDTHLDLVTDDSRVLSGHRGQPIKLKKQLNSLAAAFRRPRTRPNLPQSINGLWKADLFLGSATPDYWVGTTVKINRDHLEGARGLRVAIVPSKSGASDSIYVDDSKNLIVCPVPHDQSFMETFYEGWRVVRALCASDFRMPPEVQLPNTREREVARIYVDRRKFAIEDVLDAVSHFAQPHLLEPKFESVDAVPFGQSSAAGTATVVTPFASASGEVTQL